MAQGIGCRLEMPERSVRRPNLLRHRDATTGKFSTGPRRRSKIGVVPALLTRALKLPGNAREAAALNLRPLGGFRARP